MFGKKDKVAPEVAEESATKPTAMTPIVKSSNEFPAVVLQKSIDKRRRNILRLWNIERRIHYVIERETIFDRMYNKIFGCGKANPAQMRAYESSLNSRVRPETIECFDIAENDAA